MSSIYSSGNGLDMPTVLATMTFLFFFAAAVFALADWLGKLYKMKHYTAEDVFRMKWADLDARTNFSWPEDEARHILALEEKYPCQTACPWYEWYFLVLGMDANLYSEEVEG